MPGGAPGLQHLTSYNSAIAVSVPWEYDILFSSLRHEQVQGCNTKKDDSHLAHSSLVPGFQPLIHLNKFTWTGA